MKTKKNNILNSLIVISVLFVVVGCVCNSGRESGGDTNSASTDETSQSGSLKKDSGDFIVEHMGVKNQRYESIDRSIRKNKTLEKAADKLNRSLILPHDIPLRAKDCDGVANAFYMSRDKSITMCYELMEYFYRTFKRSGDSDEKANDRMNKAVTFIFLHELGHALIDAYQLPITANEEDAADRCSSYICIEELGDDGVKAVVAAAEFFAIQSKSGGQRSAKVMADEHLLNEQRFFNSLCMIYGSDPQKYNGLVVNNLLPKARAVRCPNEYQRTASSWSKLLKPWRKD
ncbi:MAG: hypothetical protein HKN25_10205 [Pyrinomonadaceae bacterium]|nr:hypothetical protein [Pyrinomonadaceae bacterium]